MFCSLIRHLFATWKIPPMVNSFLVWLTILPSWKIFSIGYFIHVWREMDKLRALTFMNSPILWIIWHILCQLAHPELFAQLKNLYGFFAVWVCSCINNDGGKTINGILESNSTSILNMWLVVIWFFLESGMLHLFISLCSYTCIKNNVWYT